MKETATRPGETARLTWNDIDFVSNTIKVTPEKGSNPRIFPISDKLLGMLENIRRMDYIKDSERIFQRQLRHIRRNYQRSKLRLSHKVQNPRLAKIKLKTFRTWKATTLYHQTKDPWYVMEFLGHTSLQHTRKYVMLEKAIYHSYSDDFVCKVAKSAEEAKELIELGFEFVNEIHGSYLYRKRK
jgi:integrase